MSNNNNNNDQNLHPPDALCSYTIFPTSPSSSSQPPSFQLAASASCGSLSSSTNSTLASPKISSSQTSTSSSSSLPVGLINFVGQGRHDKPAKFCVVDKNYPVKQFANMLKDFDLTKPDVLISITGSAVDFDMRSSKLEQVFDRGLLKAAQSTNAWIITGGSDAGVMKRVGQAIRGQDKVTLVPCIGIASFSRVTNNALLLNPNSAEKVQYACTKPNSMASAALNPDHTHFILVQSPIDDWGQEIEFRTGLEDYISKRSKIPLVLVAINGGPGTLETIFQGIKRGFPIIIVDGSGRASDAIAAYIKHHRYPNRFGIEAWNQFKNQIWKNMTPEQEATQNEYLKEICQKNASIILFNPNESEVEDMDKVILRSVFTFKDCDFAHKLRLGVKWGRADVLEELFQQYDTSVPANTKAEALAIALNESLRLNKPDIYELLVRKGASLDRVNIKGLYHKTRHHIQRLSTFAGCKHAGHHDDHDDHKEVSNEPNAVELKDANFQLKKSVSSLTPADSSMRSISVSGAEDMTGSLKYGKFWMDSKVNSRQSSSGQLLEREQSNVPNNSGGGDPPAPPDPLILALGQRLTDGNLLRKGKEIERSSSSQVFETTPLLSKPPTHCVTDPPNDSAGSESSAAEGIQFSIVRSVKDTWWENPKEILAAIDPRYLTLLDDGTVTYTDILMWAILADRFELAKAVWRRTKYSVHSALVACRLYKVLEGWFRDEVYKQQYAWFETSAIQVLSEMKHEDAVKVLEWQWEELSSNALELAECAECKDFFSAMHVQRNFDEKFHSRPEKKVQVAPGTKIIKILLMMLTFTLYNSEAYVEIEKDTFKTSRPKKISYFYSIPVVKLLSSTISYIIFLGILVVNIVMIDPQNPKVSRFDIMWYEWLLWIWFFSELIEEFNQFSNDRKKHFTRISNQMDAFMYILLMVYFVLRMLAWQLQLQSLLIAYTDILVLATIACFLRFMNVFAFSKSLGPLFFVIIRLFTDVWQWLFIFILFMVSFQVGIFAFTLQAGESGWDFFPTGSMGVSFTAILGDLGERTLELMSKTRFGVAVVLVYSLVTQVMLVNLLIAMMGNTYTTVKDNSDKEWKFYRYRLLSDYHSSCSVPPPLNIINMIYLRIKKSCQRPKKEDAQQKKEEAQNLEYEVAMIMKRATDIVIEHHEDQVKYALPSVSGAIYERTRLLTTQRDSDRQYLEDKIRGLEERLDKIQGEREKTQRIGEVLDKIQERLDKIQGISAERDKTQGSSGEREKTQGIGEVLDKIQGSSGERDKTQGIGEVLDKIQERLDKIQGEREKIQGIGEVLDKIQGLEERLNRFDKLESNIQTILALLHSKAI